MQEVVFRLQIKQPGKCRRKPALFREMFFPAIVCVSSRGEIFRRSSWTSDKRFIYVWPFLFSTQENHLDCHKNTRDSLV